MKYEKADLEKIGKDWLERIAASEKRERKWLDAAKMAETAYLCNNDTESDGVVPEFNILFSMVETTIPAIYNSTPAPDLRPRFNKPDPMIKLVSDVYERAISVQIDEDRMDTEVEKLAQDAVLAGRGVIRAKFVADVENEEISGEHVVYENVSWRDYREGPAKRARDVPWRAFRHTVTMAEMARISDDTLMELQADPSDDKSSLEEESVDIWEIWCKDTRQVYFVVDEICKVLKIQEDPLGLSDFFPCPDPVQPITGTGRRIPVCPYSAYKVLAEELDRITIRINAIMKGLKVRGIIAADAEGLEALTEADDNTLIPIANIEGISAAGGLQAAITWWPIDQAIAVLQQLYTQRDATKAAIYEITGVSDIVRGMSDPNETASAQRIKTQWGSQRVKRLQRMIKSHIRDLFVITAEILATNVDPVTLGRIAGVELSPEVLPMLAAPLDHYRIDIESDSTVRADLTDRRSEMGEFLSSTAAFFGTMAPIIQESPEAAAPAAEIFAAFARQFNLGKQAEDAVDQMAQMARESASQGPQEEPPDPMIEIEQTRVQNESMKLQADMQMAQMRSQEKMAEIEIAKMKLQLEQQRMQMDQHFKGLAAQTDAGELQLKAQAAGMQAEAQDFEQMRDVAELRMEQDQQRGVKLGN